MDVNKYIEDSYKYQLKLLNKVDRTKLNTKQLFKYIVKRKELLHIIRYLKEFENILK